MTPQAWTAMSNSRLVQEVLGSAASDSIHSERLSGVNSVAVQREALEDHKEAQET
jgi:hypothetical protein